MNLFLKYMIPSCSCFATSSASKIVDIDPEHHPIQQFNPSEIKNLILNTKISSIIGRGGFSTVYLANLANPRAPAAFKVHEPSRRLYKMFRQELDVLLNIRPHPNVVRLLGYSDNCGDEAGVLVFEHVPNGTLHESLHRRTKFTLSWSQRMSIAFQLATALNYLHEECELPIIHGDIKASNVLLDDDKSPKLCDFGFARMGFSATVTGSANPMMGSPGYVDPCYLRTGLVSKKSDVYSFGVLILELISGMEAFTEEKSRMLTAVMRPRLKEMAAEEIVDVRLGGEYDRDEGVTLARIAGRCIGENPSLRPAVGEILELMRKDIPSAAFGRTPSGMKNT